MKRLLLTAVVLMAVFCALQIHAQEVKFARIGPSVGMITGGDLESSSAFGLQCEVSFTERIGVELAYSRFEGEVKVDNTSFTWDQDNIALSAVVRKKMIEDLSGYLLGGLNYNMIGGGADVDDEIGFHIGAGLNMQTGDFSELFLEYRYAFVELSEDEVLNESLDSNFGLIKLGMNFVL